MIQTPYNLMQQAVDIVQASEHPTNKVAAALAGTNAEGREFAIARTNFWPEKIKAEFGRETRIGSSSGTVHAETACLMAAPMTAGASLFVTDVPCPNCVKNMAESGVRAMYIDHKGFTKDFALRRAGHFNNMSLRICEKAGISVYRIFRKEEKLEEILKIPAGFSPAIERPAIVTPLDGKPGEEIFRRIIEQKTNFYRDRNFAAAIAMTDMGRAFVISAESHPCPGYTGRTMEEDQDEKYSTILQPVNRVMMMAAKGGLKMNGKYIYASRVPTSRELVDMIGMNMNHIRIGDPAKARDKDALAAFKMLTGAGILNVQ